MNNFNDIARNYDKSKILINKCCKYLRILVHSDPNFAFHMKSNKSKVAISVGIIRIKSFIILAVLRQSV